jgi:hypothetical protein
VTALTSKRHIQVDLVAIVEAVRNSLGAIAQLAQIFTLSRWNLNCEIISAGNKNAPKREKKKPKKPKTAIP